MNTLRIVKFLGICFAFCICSGAYAGGLNLKVTVHGLRPDSLCFLANYFGDKQYLQDSTKADANGVVIFQKPEQMPRGIYLFVMPGKKYFEVVLDTIQEFQMESDIGDIIRNMKVTGCPENEYFYNYLRFIDGASNEIEDLKRQQTAAKDDSVLTKSIKEKMTLVDNKVKDYKNAYMKDHPEAFMSKVFKTSQDPTVPPTPLLPNGAKDSTFAYRYFKAHYFDDFDFSDARFLRTPLLNSKLEYYFKNLVYQIPDSIITESNWLVEKARADKEVFKYMVWYLTYKYELSNIMGMDAVFVHMVDSYYRTGQAYWVDSTVLYKMLDKATVLKPILLGKTCRNIILEDTSGVYQNMYSLKNQYVILFFWDPDCGHCKAAMPKMIDLYEKYKSKDVEIFAICTEAEVDKWKKFIQEKNLKWINVADPHFKTNVRHEFDITSTPQIFLLDKDRKIICKKVDVEHLGDFLDHMFKEKVKDLN